ncbi:hypothetical protein B0H14DRAFT_3764100 [Mycena olivaceomarginata]|nr:hypothetical protein B0H14DRAFT_3764100 [Mycena olivaceomarginata]
MNYMDVAKESNKSLVTLLNSDLDSLLLVATLFSGILVAFLIEIRKGLPEELQGVSNELLGNILKHQDPTAPEIPSLDQLELKFTSQVTWLWAWSLLLSLLSALVASLAKGWVAEVAYAVSGSSWIHAQHHCKRYRNIERGPVKLAIRSLPILIHFAFMLFTVGFAILTYEEIHGLGISAIILAGLAFSIYVWRTFQQDSPFRTPLAMLINDIRRSWGKPAAFPDQEDAQKARALAWLLTQSLAAEKLKSAILAIAGLPFDASVQDELREVQTITVISAALSEELSKGAVKANPEFITACFYALLHLVQTRNGITGVRKELILAFQSLCEQINVFSGTDTIPPSAQGAALSDKYLQHLLMQVYLLNGMPVPDGAVNGAVQNGMTHNPNRLDFRGLLRDATGNRRDKILTDLVVTAKSDNCLSGTVAKFGTILEHLWKALSSTEGSIELRRCYAKILVDVSANVSIRPEIELPTPSTVWLLMSSDDDRLRRYILDAFINIAANGTS